MGDTANNTEKPQKSSFFKGVKAEFKKVIWPDKKTVVKETSAVVVSSLVLGIIIAALDYIIKFGIELLIK